MTSAADRGRQGEETAAAFLQNLGYDIRERNVRLTRDEIDIVAFDAARGMMVFVEVKTRSGHSAAYPIRTAVDRRKLTAMKRAVNRWTILHDYDGPGRIDLVCVQGDRVVEHILDVGSQGY